ncbi:hypothetical protein E0Z10_g3319 [Xylaria hypoxylon]|uniref:RING-type domain-containing protein n=1 Tax=Xylaria hypoxylon TaxID=37992 RepID=A0A4Z0ZA71_9PEZI|nr:hypothetical protein E0Z10_g3319 [Xylaria hypoxylon]
MMVATLLSLVAKAWLALSIASLASLASAQDASVTPFDLTDYFTQSKMTLVITTAETAENAPYGSPYDVVPLTNEAGLQQTDVSKLPDVSGDLVILDYSNFTQVNYQDKIIFLCCDATTDNDTNLISPDRVLNTIMSNSVAPAAILLYSTTKSICVVGGSHLTYSRLWSMASQVDALKVHSVIATTNADTVLASIKPSSDSVESQQQQQPRPGGTSAIAMSILYSITGLITLLFLLIIGTGAVRAHRNPERYGPRASANGRPRRSRARGLAMAMLETLPIVKFGESDQRKPDEENALQAVAGAAPQAQDASQGVTEGSANVATSESSSEAASNAISQHEPESASVPTSSTPDKAKEAEPEENPLGCSICTEDFTVGEDVRVLPCDHKFHPACVDPWLVNVSGTCPLCRLDLRPPEDIEREENGETAESQDATAAADGHLAPPAETNQTLESAAAGEETQRRRRSRLFDWNRLRHASVDERLQALRQYRQSQQGSDPASSAADDERRHSRLTDRIRGRFHLRGDSRSSAATPGDSLPPTSTTQQ